MTGLHNQQGVLSDKRMQWEATTQMTTESKALPSQTHSFDLDLSCTIPLGPTKMTFGIKLHSFFWKQPLPSFQNCLGTHKDIVSYDHTGPAPFYVRNRKIRPYPTGSKQMFNSSPGVHNKQKVRFWACQLHFRGHDIFSFMKGNFVSYTTLECIVSTLSSTVKLFPWKYSYMLKIFLLLF